MKKYSTLAMKGLQIKTISPGGVAQLVEASLYTKKGCRFDPKSGHMCTPGANN